jgi:hypothetical protein
MICSSVLLKKGLFKIAMSHMIACFSKVSKPHSIATVRVICLPSPPTTARQAAADVPCEVDVLCGVNNNDKYHEQLKRNVRLIEQRTQKKSDEKRGV